MLDLFILKSKLYSLLNRSFRLATSICSGKNAEGCKICKNLQLHHYYSLRIQCGAEQRKYCLYIPAYGSLGNMLLQHCCSYSLYNEQFHNLKESLQFFFKVNIIDVWTSYVSMQIQKYV